MKLPELTGIQLKRYNSMIFAVKELIASQKLDGYDYLIDTLMSAYYGIDDIVESIEQYERERLIKHQQEYMKKQKEK